jgi:neutral trehalase
MKPLLLAVVTSLFFIGCNPPQTIEVVKAPPTAKVTDMILKVPIHIEDNGYNNFNSIVITKQKKLDEFIKDIKTQKSWKRKKNFLETIAIQKIDFNKKNLLIYRIEESSSTIVLAVDVPKTLENHITVVIGREVSKDVSKKIKYYALAYIVDKKIIDVTFDDGKKSNLVVNSD